MHRASRFGAAVLLVCAFSAPAATVKKADDTTVTGPLVALENGAVVLNVDADGKPQRTPIALDDVVELTVDAAADVPKDPPPDGKAPQSQPVTAPAAPKGPEMTSIFDGKTLKGWEGKEGVWTVVDGALTGKAGEDARSNRPTYLIYTAEEFGDFELHYKFKITGGRPNSSGVQFRSRVLQQGDVKDLSGYQQDLGVPAGMTGGIVDNASNAGGQALKAQPGERVVYTPDKQRNVTPLDKPVEQLNALLKENDWNDAIIVAKGQRLLSMINGEIFAAATNDTGVGVTSGLLGIQLSTRVDMTVQFKDIRIRKLGPKDKPSVAGHPWDQPTGTATATAAAEKASDKPAAAGAPAAPANPDAVATAEAWQVRPVGGESIRGELLAWDDQHLRLKTAFGELTFPVKQLSEVWHANSADIAKARAAIRSEKSAKPGQVTEDVAFARKDDQVIPVTGLVLGVEKGGALKFRFREEERKILPDKLVGVILASALDENAPAAAGNDALRQVLVLQGGDVVAGQWTAFEKGAVTLATRWGTQIVVPIKQIERIQTKNGRLTYVSDLTPAQVEQTPYFDRMVPFRNDVSLTGQPIKLSDGQHAKGISVHSRTVLRYDIGRRFERFRAKVGFQQPEGKAGRAAIRVLGDGDKVLHEIADARGDQPPADLDVPVAGVSRLTLEVDFGADQDVGDRVAWANARLIRAAAPPVR